MPAGDVCYAHMAGVPQDATHPYSVPVPFIWRFIIIYMCETKISFSLYKKRATLRYLQKSVLICKQIK